jgi:hypothetical protein
VGPYPQLLLCGHIGNAPISIRIKITSKIVPIIAGSPKNLQIGFTDTDIYYICLTKIYPMTHLKAILGKTFYSQRPSFKSSASLINDPGS